MHKTASGISMPIAYIATNRNRLKVYNLQNLYMRGGQEFQIELFNPLQETIAAKIYLNGKAISNSMIVLKPGERSFLERFIDDNKKFKFDTYEVENSAEAAKAIEKNGIVRVEFFKEQAPSSPIVTTTYTYPTYIQTSPFYVSSPNVFNSGTYYSTGCTGTMGPSGTTTTTSSLNFASLGASATRSATMDSTLSDSVETGRVESGGASSQSFGMHYGSFNSYYFTSVEYKLMPESHKPIEVNKIRNYCSECGNRMRKSTWKFCPGCGTPVE